MTATHSSDPVRTHAKAITRLSAVSRRDAMGAAERAAASHVISQTIARDVFASLPAGSIVTLYAAKGSEVATSELDQAARTQGLVVGYPRVMPGTRVLKFFAVEIAMLEPSQFGLREPTITSTELQLADIAVMVIPALAVDATGARIGWGRGYYDSTLPLATHALRVAAVFDCQWVDEVPRAPHDSNVNLIITETRAHRIDG
ncbi:MAG: 5-formyltetrahydrofolate cyclo-ligase [Kofleriaceae bacterium]|nr:5-formyltetrahydrofolate cyclo-ligase [Kofleriaceae bacterium]